MIAPRFYPPHFEFASACADDAALRRAVEKSGSDVLGAPIILNAYAELIALARWRQ